MLAQRAAKPLLMLGLAMRRERLRRGPALRHADEIGVGGVEGEAVVLASFLRPHDRGVVGQKLPAALFGPRGSVGAIVVQGSAAWQPDFWGRYRRATEAARNVFPSSEAALIAELIRRDGPYYDASISREFVSGMNRFAREIGILKVDPSYEDVAATEFGHVWSS